MSSDSNYEKLSDELQNKINTELFDGNGFKDNAIRRIDKEHDRATLWRRSEEHTSELQSH